MFKIKYLEDMHIVLEITFKMVSLTWHFQKKEVKKKLD